MNESSRDPCCYGCHLFLRVVIIVYPPKLLLKITEGSYDSYQYKRTCYSEEYTHIAMIRQEEQYPNRSNDHEGAEEGGEPYD